MIKTVAFDLDNTLYNYSACNIKAERELSLEIEKCMGVDRAVSKELLETAKKNIKSQLGDVAASHNRLLYMQNICEQCNIKPGKYAIKLYNIYWDAILNNMKLYSYVEPLLIKLQKNGVALAVLTDLTAYIQYRKLDKLGIAESFDYIITSEEAGEEKPSCRMFNLLLNKTGNHAGEVLMIGDSKTKDFDGAIACGMNAILFSDETSIMRDVGEFL